MGARAEIALLVLRRRRTTMKDEGTGNSGRLVWFFVRRGVPGERRL